MPIRFSLVFALSAMVLAAPLSATAVTYIESPSLAAAVSAKTLPPVAERVPQEPSIANFSREGARLGEQGGSIRMLMAKAKETRQMVVYGYARLVGYDDQLLLTADVLKAYKVEEGRIFTLTLRKGHKWSDGHPFTTEDFRYWWEDVANNKELSPAGPPVKMLADGAPPKVDILSETEIRFTWPSPNPEFVPALAQASPMYIYAPAHYLKQFHGKYADQAMLDAMVKSTKRRGWASLHNRQDNAYKNDNPELPTLQPWVVQTAPPAERFVFKRNPFYHRVDANGVQLPYLDEVNIDIVSGKLIPAKAGSGEVDLQGRYLQFKDTPFLKQNEEQYNYVTHLWRTGKGAQLALYPNMNAKDPVWRSLFRDVRFRRALSLATNREEINEVVYFGVALPHNNALLPGSPLYSEEAALSYAAFDLKKANALLDDMGLKRGDDGIRLLPDGRKAEIIAESAGESTEETDVLQLVHDTWRQAGIKLYTKPLQREVLRNRVFTGDTLLSIWFGLENGLASAQMSPEEFAPTSQQQLQWPMWGQYLETKGEAGEPVDMAGPKHLFERYQAWRLAPDAAAQEAIWREMIKLYADQVYSIGLVSGALQPVVATKHLQNVPVEGYYNWDPGAHFGCYRPDGFWLASK
jgi:peptide/nickel transport system substrate-binding protein